MPYQPFESGQKALIITEGTIERLKEAAAGLAFCRRLAITPKQ
jgi:hypothetical protein